MSEFTTPLMIIKKKLLQADLFLGCIENYYCVSQSNGCALLKEGIQRLMDDRLILFEKTPSMESLCKSMPQDPELEDVSVITSFGTPIRITFKGLVKITAKHRISPLII